MEIEEKPIRRGKYITWIIPPILFIILIMMMYDISAFQNCAFTVKSWVMNNRTSSNSSKEIEKLELKSQNNISLLENKLETLIPSKPYIVINTTTNRFSLRKANGDTIRTGACSTGKDEILIDGKNKPHIFQTPRGLLTILNKRTSPVWIKPDWAFTEEGRTVPPAGSKERIDPYALGDYALGIGNSYFIHGTLYQRFLGYGATHGCIRIGDADLEVIYNTLSIGSKVLIY